MNSSDSNKGFLDEHLQRFHMTFGTFTFFPCYALQVFLSPQRETNHGRKKVEEGRAKP